MTIYITWPISQDADFRSAYERQTMESIQSSPLMCRNGLNYTVGTSRATADDIEAISLMGINVECSPEPYEVAE